MNKLKLAKKLLDATHKALTIKKELNQPLRDKQIETALHLKQVNQIEIDLTKTLKKFFKLQIKSALANLTQLQTPPTQASQIFKPEEWHKLLINTTLPILAHHVTKAMWAQQKLMHIDIDKIRQAIQNSKKSLIDDQTSGGINAEPPTHHLGKTNRCPKCNTKLNQQNQCPRCTKPLQRTRQDSLQQRKTSINQKIDNKTSTAQQWLDDHDIDFDESLRNITFNTPEGPVTVRFAVEMPPWMKKKTKELLEETFAQDYWEGINDTTDSDIEDVLTEGTANGWSIPQMAQEIADSLGGDAYALRRATAISRTESGHALNGARSAAADNLIESVAGEDLPMKKVWLSILGTTTRPSHANLDGVPCDENGRWNLGGILIRWPGDIFLPPGLRINCQCTLIVRFGMTDGDAQALRDEYVQRISDQLKQYWRAKVAVSVVLRRTLGIGRLDPRNASFLADSGSKSPEIDDLYESSRVLGLPPIWAKPGFGEKTALSPVKSAISILFEAFGEDLYEPSRKSRLLALGKNPENRQFRAPSEKSGNNSTKYGCLMLEIPGDWKDKILDVIKSLPDSVIGEGGREDWPHVTIKYGYHDNVTAHDVLNELSKESPPKITLGKVTLFKAMGDYETKRADGDSVLKIDVHSPDLQKLRAKVDHFDNSDQFPEYHPHITLAYVKKGVMLDVGHQLQGAEIEPFNLVYSDKDKNKHHMKMGDFPDICPACPKCGSFETNHARTDGSGNAVCGGCGSIFTDSMYGQKSTKGGPGSGPHSGVRRVEDKELESARMHLSIKNREDAAVIVEGRRKKSELNWLDEAAGEHHKVASDAIFGINPAEKSVYLSRIDAHITGEGYGKELLHTMMNHFAEHGYEKMSTYVQHIDQASHSMMRKLGGIQRDYGDHGSYYDFDLRSDKDKNKSFTQKSTGDNCGTGYGGFKPGNTCAKGGSKKLEFGGNKVEFDKDSEVHQAMHSLFGRALTDEEISDLGGAPKGSKVRATGLMGYGEKKNPTLTIYWENVQLDGSAYRSMRMREGKLVMYNVSFEIKEGGGQGYGTQIFHREVQECIKHNVHRIETTAECCGDQGYNGYYTWPRLGYDGGIPLKLKSKLPESLKSSKGVSDLMKTQEGRDWWKSNGDSFIGRFDLKDGSLSRKVLDEYIRAKFGE